MPEAEAAIGSWRRLHTTDGAAGMPAHVTLVYPFAPVGEIDFDWLAGMFGGSEPFDYVLQRLDEFPVDGVSYLAPEPPEPFVALTRALVDRFPAHAPYGGAFEVGELIPHVTVVHTDDDRARAEAAASVSDALPIACSASEARLMHEVEGRWQSHTRFRLGR